MLEYLDVAGMLEFALDADIDARLVSGMFLVHKSFDRDPLVSKLVSARVGVCGML